MALSALFFILLFTVALNIMALAVVKICSMLAQYRSKVINNGWRTVEWQSNDTHTLKP